MGEEETPISRRDAACRYYAFSMWGDPGEAESHIGWARELAQAMQPFTAEGIQLNFMSVEGDERVRSTFGPKKYERLVALKEKYDPDNVFRINQNIKPSVGRVESASAEE